MYIRDAASGFTAHGLPVQRLPESSRLPATFSLESWQLQACDASAVLHVRTRLN